MEAVLRWRFGLVFLTALQAKSAENWSGATPQEDAGPAAPSVAGDVAALGVEAGLLPRPGEGLAGEAA